MKKISDEFYLQNNAFELYFIKIGPAVFEKTPFKQVLSEKSLL